MTGVYKTTHKLLKQKQEEAEAILSYSQAYPFSLDCGSLINQWYHAKKPFIRAFKGHTMVRSDKPITIEFSAEQRARKFKELLSTLVRNNLLSAELKAFLENNQEGLFSNRVVYPFPAYGISSGTKLSKSCRKFFNSEEQTRQAQDIISQYIQVSRIEGYLYLSVDPIDYLTISENNSNWRSCHTLDGDYRAGNLNYMVDNVTLVAYIANEQQESLICMPPEMAWNNKKWRMLVHSIPGQCAYYNKQYPYTEQLLLEKVHALVKSCLDKELNGLAQYGIKSYKTDEPFEGQLCTPHIVFGNSVYNIEFLINADDYLGFSDLIDSREGYLPIAALNEATADRAYDYSVLPKTTSTLFQDYKNMYGLFGMKIGEKALCPCCGKRHIEQASSFLCPECIAIHDADEDFYVSCGLCGHRIYEESEAIWIDNTPYCEHCYNTEVISTKGQIEWP